jgi:hypothetical protein
MRMGSDVKPNTVSPAAFWGKTLKILAYWRPASAQGAYDDFLALGPIDGEPPPGPGGPPGGMPDGPWGGMHGHTWATLV